MDRCRLKGIEGDQLNAILSATGMNFRKLLKAASRLPAFLCHVFAHLFEVLEQGEPFPSVTILQSKIIGRFARECSLWLKNLPSDRRDQIIVFA